MGAGSEAAGLEIGQQARILLGLLGDPVDRGPLVPPSISDRRMPGRAAPRASGVDRIAVRAGLGWPSISSRRASTARRDRRLEPLGLDVRFGPAEADDLGEQPLAQGVAPEDPVRRRPAGRRQDEDAALGLDDEPVGDEPTEHLARGLGG